VSEPAAVPEHAKQDALPPEVLRATDATRCMTADDAPPPPTSAHSISNVDREAQKGELESAQINMDHQGKCDPLPPQRFDLHRALQIATLSTALAATAIGVFGYGVGLAAEQLGGYGQTLVSSPLDAFALFVQGVPHLIVGADRVFADWRHVVPKLWLQTLPISAMITILLLTYFFVRPYVKSRRARRTRVKPSPPAETRKPLVANTIKVCVSVLGGSVSGVVMLLAALFAIQTAVGLVAILPLLGYSCGQVHIAERVIGPDTCGGTYTRAQHLGKAKGRARTGSASTCVEIIKDEKALGRGRVVFSVPSKMMLYGPVSGMVAIVPTDGAAISMLGHLPDELPKLAAPSSAP
jgi:hypothetical protein